MEEKQTQDKQVILIADDSEMNRAILTDMLGDDYEIIEAENGAEAVRIIQAQGNAIDLLLLDINMPELDGFQVLEAMNREQRIGDLPVIMISSENGSSFVERSYDLGASDYISRPFDARVVHRRVVNTLMLYAKQKKLAQMVAEQVYEKERGNNLMISILSHIMEFRNGESGRHVVNIRTVTEILIRFLMKKTDRYPLKKGDIALISTASALHDIGKLSIPDEILNKPGRFTEEEFRIMKTHSAAGADMLKKLTDFQDEPLVKTAYQICRWHHERWDGRGYPDGLKGDEIPISAQIVAMADVYDALTSERCYKKAFPHDTAIHMITNGECGAFNPILIDCLLEAAPIIPSELQSGSLDQTGEKQAHRVVEELLNRGDMGGSVRMPWSLEMEQEKTRFLALKAEEIQFDFNASADTVTLSEWGARRLGFQTTVLSAVREDMALMNDLGVQAISEALRKTTPESPEIDQDFLISVSGELRWHRAVAKSLWDWDENGPKFLGAVGKLVDVHDRFIQETEGVEIRGMMDDREAAMLIKELRRVFDEVRLIDVDQMQRINNGKDSSESDQCSAVWGKPHRCADCVSAKALEQKNQFSKFEFAGEDLYQVIARYVEVNGKPCVMEMVSKLRDVDLRERGFEDFFKRMKGYNSELYLDSLTGAYNRRYYDDQVKTLNSFDAVSMVDVDDFKHINDTYGHYAGDLALQAIASAMNGCIRSSDVLLRYGGDEFLLIYPEIPEHTFEEKQKQIQAAVREIQISEFPDISLSVSIGGVYGIHPLLKAVRLADKRMYEAKARFKMARSKLDWI